MQILIVVVLYKRSPAQSQTIMSLAEVFAQQPQLLPAFQIFVWDNTPEPAPRQCQEPTFPFPCIYRRATRNLGTAGAYNQALVFAESVAAPWLLLFDQDTTVSPEFLPRILAYSERLQNTTEIATVVPFIYSHGALVSPRSIGSFNRVRQIPITFNGVFKQLGYAVNSATLMRVASLREIGGYSEEFWLDLSDVYAFQELFRRGRYMYVAADLQLQHSIAAMDFDKEMTPQRYRNFLAAESAYVDLYTSLPEQAVHLFRLLVRTVRQYRRYDNKIFARICWEYFNRRLFHSRSNRLQGWRTQLAQRDIPVVEDGQVIG